MRYGELRPGDRKAARVFLFAELTTVAEDEHERPRAMRPVQRESIADATGIVFHCSFTMDASRDLLEPCAKRMTRSPLHSIVVPDGSRERADPLVDRPLSRAMTP